MVGRAIHKPPFTHRAAFEAPAADKQDDLQRFDPYPVATACRNQVAACALEELKRQGILLSKSIESINNLLRNSPASRKWGDPRQDVLETS
jgi:hypothetical protein